MFQVTRILLYAAMISKYFFLLPATVTLQIRRLNLMFFPSGKRDEVQLGEV
jgi:hypothetical protein